MSDPTRSTILLVEDEAIIAMMEQSQLEALGYRVVHAFTGEAALAVMQAREPAVDLILMDIDLGKGMDGTEAAKTILARWEVPVVFLSSHVEKEVVQKTEAITSYGYVVKNSGVTVLDASIKMAFRLFKARQALQSHEELLREREGRLRAITENIADTIIQSDRAGKILFVNRLAPGLELPQVLGMTVFDFVPPEQRTVVEAALAAVFETGLTQHYESLGPGDGGINELFEVRVSPIKVGETISSAVFLARNVGEQRRLANHLQESEARYAALFQNLNSNFILHEIILDPAGKPCDYRYLDLNPAAERAIGLKAEQLVGKTARELFPGTEQYWIDQFGAVALGGEPIQYENYSQELDRYFDMRIYSPRKGLFALLGIDVSERRRAEAALAESEARFRLLAENSNDFISRHDTAGRYLYASPSCRKLLGYEPEELLGRSAFDIIHPEDRERVEQSRSGIVGERAVSVTSFRCRRKDGSYVWLETISHVVEMGPGKENEIHATSRDITEHQRIEEALRESKQYTDQIIKSAQEGIVVYDRELRYRLWNPVMEQLSGKPAAEVLGRQAVEVFPALRDNGVLDMLETALAGQQISMDLPFTNASQGRAGWASDSSGPLRNAKGEIVGVIGIINDITVRKRYEEEMVQQLAEKEVLLGEVHHRIKNNIASIEAVLQLQLQNLKHPEAIAAIQDSLGRVKSMRILYERLLVGGSYAELALKPYVEGLVPAILSLFPDRADLKVSYRIEECRLPPKTVVSLGIIINELVTNILKYAFGPGEGGEIEVSLVPCAAGMRLQLQDNGRGLPGDFQPEATGGFGMKLVKMISAQLGGSFRTQIGEGLTSIIEFPLES